MAAKIKKGDKVVVLAGRDKGKTGEVLRILTKDNRAIVQGVNVAKRHTRPSASNQGGIVDKELGIHISNLALDRIDHPSEVVKKGQSIEAKILTIRKGGKRVGLGLKQMVESPWKAFARVSYPDRIVEAVWLPLWKSELIKAELVAHDIECAVVEDHSSHWTGRSGIPHARIFVKETDLAATEQVIHDATGYPGARLDGR